MKRTIVLTPEQKKLYKDMKEKAIAFLNGKMVSSATVITQLMRLHQITCGHFKSDDGDTQNIKSNRINELMNVLDEIEGKAIIWAHYRHDIETIVKEVQKKYGEDFYMVDRPRKHRYFYLLGTRKEKHTMRSKLAYSVLPFPKGNNKRYDSSYKIDKQGILF